MSDIHSPSEKRLVYVFDPLCGWCYGFSPVVRQLVDATKRRAQWDVLAGGMIVGDRVGPIGQLSDFLKQTIPRLEMTTGVKFGQPFHTQILEPGTQLLSSLEPSRAIQTVKILAHDRALAYAGLLQKALYEQGRDITSLSVLGELAEEVRVVGFEIEYLKTSTYEATLDEFHRVSALGITGFPTLVGFDGDEGRVFSRGWSPFDRVFDVVNRWLET